MRRGRGCISCQSVSTIFFLRGFGVPLVDIMPLDLDIEVAQFAGGERDFAPVGRIYQQLVHFPVDLAGSRDVAGFNEFLEFQYFEVQDILVVAFSRLFDAFQYPEAFHIEPFVVEDMGEVELFADLEFDIVLDVDQPQAGEQLFKEVPLR